MPKISSMNAKSVIIKFVLKSLILTIVVTVPLSALFSFVFLKVDLDLKYIKYCGYIICAVTAFAVPYFCLKSFKNNISVLSFISIIAVVIFAAVLTVAVLFRKYKKIKIEY